jgi:hypothetical protein
MLSLKDLEESRSETCTSPIPNTLSQTTIRKATDTYAMKII